MTQGIGLAFMVGKATTKFAKSLLSDMNNIDQWIDTRQIETEKKNLKDEISSFQNLVHSMSKRFNFVSLKKEIPTGKLKELFNQEIEIFNQIKSNQSDYGTNEYHFSKKKNFELDMIIATLEKFVVQISELEKTDTKSLPKNVAIFYQQQITEECNHMMEIFSERENEIKEREKTLSVIHMENRKSEFLGLSRQEYRQLREELGTLLDESPHATGYFLEYIKSKDLNIWVSLTKSPTLNKQVVLDFFLPTPF